MSCQFSQQWGGASEVVHTHAALWHKLRQLFPRSRCNPAAPLLPGSSRPIGFRRPSLLAATAQEHFRGDCGAERLVPELNRTIDLCHRLGVPVIFTQHGHPDPEAEEDTNVLVKWWGAEDSIR